MTVPPDPNAAQLVHVTERVHDNGWSLRSALVRYAQLSPERAARLFELVRRIETAVRPYINDPDRIVRDAPELAQVAERLDEAGGALTEWAASPGVPPHEELDAAARDVFGRLSDLGITGEPERLPDRQ